MQKTATFPNESKISRRKVWSVSKIRVSLHPQTATQCTPNAPMAESVDASVSNTDRETCAGSTPARSTATDWQSQRLSVCLFLLRPMRRQASVDSLVMKTIFNSTWVGNHICTEEATLSQLDGYNKTRYSRRKKKEGLLELASREAHEQQNVYFATILNEDDSPYCAIESNVGYFGLDFLRDNYDDYLTFQYREQRNQNGKLFLKAIFLFECYPGTDKRMRRIDFSYTHEGGCSSVIYQGKAYDGTFEMITTEHPPISAEELELLWVDYPKFGEYDQLIRLDRIPKGALDRILEYTDKEFPAFRQYLQRDIERYQEPKK